MLPRAAAMPQNPKTAKTMNKIKTRIARLTNPMTLSSISIAFVL